MFYIDGKYLDVNSDTPEAREYRNLRKRITEEYEWPISIKTRRGQLINITGVKDHDKVISIPNKTLYECEGVTREWTYTPSHPVNVKGIQTFPESRINIKGAMLLNRNSHIDVDKAIYLMFISEHGVSYSNKIYYEDRKKEAQKYVQSKASMSAVNYYLYDEDSPLTEQDIRTIAMSLGISKADDEKFSLDEVKMQLETAIVNGEKTGDKSINYQAFKEHVKGGENVIFLANIQKMFDENVVLFDDVHCDFWILDESGKKLDRFFKISTQDIYRKEKLLMAWLRSNPTYLETVEKRIGVSSLDIETRLTKEELDKMNWNTLRFTAKKMNVNTYGKERKEVIKEILEIGA